MLFADVIIQVSVAEVSDNRVPESYIVLTGFFGFFKADNKYKSLCLKKKNKWSIQISLLIPTISLPSSHSLKDESPASSLCSTVEEFPTLKLHDLQAKNEDSK